MNKHCERHSKSTKKVFWYLKGTLNFGIMYTNEFDVDLATYPNSYSAINPDDKKSTIRYVFNIGSWAISWINNKEPNVSLSSTEAEYKSLTNGTWKTIWLRRILGDVEETQQEPTLIRCGNKSTIKLENNPIYHARANHIATQQHFVREKEKSKEIYLSFCNTNENVASIFTKPLGKIKFEIFISCVL